MANPKKMKALLLLVGAATKDACVISPYSARRGGYSLGPNRGRGVFFTHRFVCEMFHGPTDHLRTQAAHSCGNRVCVNPHHLRWATPLENAQDKIAHGTVRCGQQIAGNILTPDQVLEAYRSDETQGAVARRLGVHKATIQKIRSGGAWAWLTRHGLCNETDKPEEPK